MPSLMESIVTLDVGAQEPWPNDVQLFQPYPMEQILLPDNANCLATQAFLRMCGLPFQIEHRSNAEFMSPSGKVPFIKCGAFVVSELEPIVQFVANKGISLTEELDNEQKSDLRAYMSLIFSVLMNAELYICWCDKKTYNEVTKIRNGSVYPWPLNHFENWSKKSAITKKLKLLGWNQKTLGSVYQEVENCCQALSERLEGKEFFFGPKPTEVDAALFGHTFSVLSNPIHFPDLFLIFHNFPNLVTHCKHICYNYIDMGYIHFAKADMFDFIPDLKSTLNLDYVEVQEIIEKDVTTSLLNKFWQITVNFFNRIIHFEILDDDPVPEIENYIKSNQKLTNTSEINERDVSKLAKIISDFNINKNEIYKTGLKNKNLEIEKINKIFDIVPRKTLDFNINVIRNLEDTEAIKNNVQYECKIKNTRKPRVLLKSRKLLRNNSFNSRYNSSEEFKVRNKNLQSNIMNLYHAKLLENKSRHSAPVCNHKKPNTETDPQNYSEGSVDAENITTENCFSENVTSENESIFEPKISSKDIKYRNSERKNKIDSEWNDDFENDNPPELPNISSMTTFASLPRRMCQFSSCSKILETELKFISEFSDTNLSSCSRTSSESLNPDSKFENVSLSIIDFDLD